MSGVGPFSLAAWGEPESKPASWTQKLALNLSCPAEDTDIILDCLKGVDADNITEVTLQSVSMMITFLYM